MMLEPESQFYRFMLPPGEARTWPIDLELDALDLLADFREAYTQSLSVTQALRDMGCTIQGLEFKELVEHWSTHPVAVPLCLEIKREKVVGAVYDTTAQNLTREQIINSLWNEAQNDLTGSPAARVSALKILLEAVTPKEEQENGGLPAVTVILKKD